MVDQILSAYSVFLRWFANLQGREAQLFSELEARYGPAKKPINVTASTPKSPKPRAAHTRKFCFEQVERAHSAVESAGDYFSQDNPVIREITQRVQRMYVLGVPVTV